MRVGTLIILSGLPGSGKSTLAGKLATHLSATYLRIDTIEQGLRDICEVSGNKGEGYRLAYRIAQENLRLGNTVIADSVNPLSLTRKEWNNVAQKVGAHFVNIEVVCSDRSEHKRRIESRKSSVLGLKLPTWTEVLEREYHPWSDDRSCIDTNKGIDETFEELLLVLKSRLSL